MAIILLRVGSMHMHMHTGGRYPFNGVTGVFLPLYEIQPSSFPLNLT